LGRFEGETAARLQQIADATVANLLRILYHVALAKVLTRGGAATFFRQDISTSAIIQSSRFAREWGRAPMKQSEARVLLLQQWDEWILTQAIDPDGPTGKDSLRFFYELEDDGSPLLEFQARGQDKWRIIHSWLLGAQRLSDHWISPPPRIPPTRKLRPPRRKAAAEKCG
jgi:hypothetical protein